MHHVRRAALLSGGAGLTDGQLLGWFLEQHSEAAFEALMRRHGPMVLGVCRRALGHAQDAEDAFQATFLVLAQRANSIVPREAVANWLYGVARRTALGAKAKAARRRAKEKQVRAMPHPLTKPEAIWQDLEPILDEELGRLPDKYRLPVLLCDLESRPRKEVARQLKIPEGTLSSRLAAARKLLAGLLSRRGVALSAGALAAALSGRAPACVPAPLFGSTLEAAAIVAAGQVAPAGLIAAEVAALVEGAKKTMFVAKLKVLVALVLTTALLGTGAGLLARQAPKAADAPGSPPPKSDKRPGSAALAAAKPFRLEGHPPGAPFASFADSGKALITVDWRGTVRLYDASTGRERRSFKTIDCSTAALAPDGKTLAVGGWKKLALYNVASGRALWEAPWPPDQQGFGRCWGVAFTPDGKRVVSGSDDCFLRVWEVASGKKQREDFLKEEGGGKRVVIALALAPDGRTLAYGAQRYSLTSEDMEKLKRGKSVLVTGLVGSLILRLRDLDTGKEVELSATVLGVQKMWWPGIRAIAMSPDGRHLAAIFQTSPGEPGPQGWFPGVIRVWDVPARRELPPFGKPQKNLVALAFSPDARTLASIRWDGTISCWEMAAGKVRRHFAAGPGKDGGTLTFAPDGRRVLSGIRVPEVWEVRGPASKDGAKPRPLAAEALKAFWADLASQDAERAHRAIGALTGAPQRSLPFLDAQIRSSTLADAPRVKRLILDLGSAKFAVREQATRELERLGETSEPALRKTLAARPAAEARRRVESLLAGEGGIIRSSEALRVARAVEALDHVGSSEARKVLEALARDLPDTWAAQQAALSLGRWEKGR
jgi:RNA polymerase sigma factor (sigma-70 family)